MILHDVYRFYIFGPLRAETLQPSCPGWTSSLPKQVARPDGCQSRMRPENTVQTETGMEGSRWAYGVYVPGGRGGEEGISM